VKQLFEAALSQRLDHRDRFVSEACNGDVELEAQLRRLLSADKVAGSFLEVPAIFELSPLQRLVPGRVLCERFEIIRFLGEGGMGQVYEARDVDLSDRIALKAIRSEISSDPAVLSRFKREVQLTRRITHPNVCRMFDLGRHLPSSDSASGVLETEITFLTMELLEGYTLADVLDRCGQLKTSEALPLAKQMAAGLAAAHDLGIIHSDFKPSNVLLVPSSVGQRAVITDFGLARVAMPEKHSLATGIAASKSGSDHLIGTLLYMAPEQLESGTATVASDIYSLGLVLYEMVTGERPFRSENVFAEVILRLKKQPASPRTLVRDLETKWEEVICRCLETDPSSRFSNVSDVIRVLDDRSTFTVPDKRDRAVQVPKALSDLESVKKSKHSPKRVALISLLVLIVMAFSYPILRFPFRDSVYENTGGHQLLVTDIANEAHDPDFDVTTELIRAGLSQSALITLSDQAQIRETLKLMGNSPKNTPDPDFARQVAWRAGIPLILFGTVSRVAEDYRLDLKLEAVGGDPTDPRESWVFSESTPRKSEFFEIVHRGTVWARQRIGESKNQIDERDRKPENVTTGNWEALKLYSDGQKLASTDRLSDAALLFKEAGQKDPDFAMAWMRLGDTLDTEGESEEGFRYWQKALSVSGMRRLTQREELRIRGMYSSDTGDLKSAEEFFGQYSIAYPNDYLGFFYRGYPLMLQRKTEEAVRILEEAERLAPTSYYVADHLARYDLILGNLQDAGVNLEKVRRLGRAEYADQVEGEASFLKGDSVLASKLFQSLRNSEDPYLKSVSYRLEACVLAEQGRYKQSAIELNAGIAYDRRAGNPGDLADKLLALSYLYFKQKDPKSSRIFALDAMKVEPSLRRAADVGSLLARQGWLTEAKKILEEQDFSSHTVVSEVTRHRLQGEILLAEGRTRQAMVELEVAKKTDQEIALLHDYWPRALIAVGRPDEALQQLDDLRRQRGQVWHQAEYYPPGYAADLLFQYAQLASHLRKSEAPAVLDEYLRLREAADQDNPDVREARATVRKIRNKS
jgi:serine/threonine protein kinase/tetratricopeptide (TPR) repeat protein